MATVAKQEPTPVGAICPHCERPIAVVVRGQWSVWEPDYMDLPVKFTAGNCPQCHNPLMYEQEANPDPSSSGWDDPIQIHPQTARRMSTEVPRPMRVDLEEARNVMRVKGYNSAVIMARRVLEGICKDQGFTAGRSLFDRLKAMQSAGVIDARLYDWADVVRDVGNEGAHEPGSQVSRQDAEEVLAFVEALLDYLYVFRSRYDEFKARRDAAKAAKKAATSKKATAKKSTGK